MDSVRVKVIGNDWRREGIPERSKRVDVDFSILDLRLHAKAQWTHCSKTDVKPGVETRILKAELGGIRLGRYRLHEV